MSNKSKKVIVSIFVTVSMLLVFALALGPQEGAQTPAPVPSPQSEGALPSDGGPGSPAPDAAASLDQGEAGVTPTGGESLDPVVPEATPTQVPSPSSIPGTSPSTTRLSTVPDVSELGVLQAVDRLRNAGLTPFDVQFTTAAPSAKPGLVLNTLPTTGSEVPRGSRVTLTVYLAASGNVTALAGMPVPTAINKYLTAGGPAGFITTFPASPAPQGPQMPSPDGGVPDASSPEVTPTEQVAGTVFSPNKADLTKQVTFTVIPAPLKDSLPSLAGMTVTLAQYVAFARGVNVTWGNTAQGVAVVKEAADSPDLKYGDVITLDVVFE